MIGGLISAHLLSYKAGLDLDPGWPCSGPLLTLSENLARKILPGLLFHIVVLFIILWFNSQAIKIFNSIIE